MPLARAIRAAREAGVEAVTVGSDSHTVDGLGARLDEAVSRLEKAGYSHLCVYEGRRNRKLSLDEVRRK